MFRKQNTTSILPAWSARSGLRPLARLALIGEHPIWSALLACAVYACFTAKHGTFTVASQTAYYNYLADALLHGQLHLRVMPPTTYDLSLYQGRYYLYWPPMPAILLMPFVAVFGVRFSDTLFTLGIAGLNVALVALLLRQACIERVIKLSKARRGLLVLCFALGTVELTLAPFGRVWNTGQLAGCMFVALGYLAALRMRGGQAFLVTGLAIASAFLVRNHLLFAGVWPACYLIAQHRSATWRRMALNIAIGMLPLVAAVIFTGWYNWARFGSVADTGLDYHRMAEVFVEDYHRYGAFHPHYLPKNLFYQYLAYPLPVHATTFEGGSLFLLTPVFFAIFPGIVWMRPRWSMWALVATIALIATPILLLMGTGWVQFGPRYTLDFTVPMLLLTAVGLRRCPLQLLSLLTIISIASYLIGTAYLASVI